MPRAEVGFVGGLGVGCGLGDDAVGRHAQPHQLAGHGERTLARDFVVGACGLVGRRAGGVLLRVGDDAHRGAVVLLDLRHLLQHGEVVAGEACGAGPELDHRDLDVAAG